MGNPLHVGTKKVGDSEGGGDDDKDDEVDAKGQSRKLLLHLGSHEYMYAYKSIGGRDEDGGNDTKAESQGRKQVDNANASEIE